MVSSGVRLQVRVLMALVAALAVVLWLGAGSAMAQGDFDFTEPEGGDDAGGDTGGGDAGGGDGFDFTEPGGGDAGVTVQMPDGSKPIVVAWFDPADATDPRVLSRLTDALIEHLGEFEDLDAVNGLIIKQDLDRLDEEARSNCIYDPVCLAEMGKALKVQHIIVGRIFTEGEERPRIALELIDVETGALANVIEFDAAATVQGQARELRPAAYKLFGRQIPVEGAGLTVEKVDKPWISTGQLVAAISTGVVGVALIGTGAAFGVMASDGADEIEAAKGKPDGMTQREAKTKLDEANSNATIANVMYGIGGVALATTVVLLLVRPGEEISDETTGSVDFYLNPSIGAEGGGVVGGFTF